jgi:hypothetical protein
LVGEGVLHSHELVLQPAVVRPQGLHHGIKGLILSPVPIKVRAQLGEAIELLARLALQLLQIATRGQRRESGQKKLGQEKTGKEATIE